jgi:hypothetical protein
VSVCLSVLATVDKWNSILFTEKKMGGKSH